MGREENTVFKRLCSPELGERENKCLRDSSVGCREMRVQVGFIGNKSYCRKVTVEIVTFRNLRRYSVQCTVEWSVW